MHPALSGLPLASLDALENSVRVKFNAYFKFTGSLKRDVPNYPHPSFTYPNDSLISDLTLLAALFGETYEAFKQNSALPQFASMLASDADLREDFRCIVEGDGGQGSDSSFWMFPPGGTGKVCTQDALSVHLEHLLQTLRNGFLHFHWRYDDLSALDYWNAQHWSINGADQAFDLANRPRRNYMAYLADAAPPWDSGHFWTLKNLRIVVTPYIVLRYHLHLSLQKLLNNCRVNVFQHARS
jgi:hypothetical protein